MLSVLTEQHAVGIPISDFLVTDPRESLFTEPGTGRYLGMSVAWGKPCHHLAFSGKSVDWQLWIEPGERFIPRRFVLTYKLEAEQPQYTVNFLNWNFPSDLPELLFDPEAPNGFEKVDVPKFDINSEEKKQS